MQTKTKRVVASLLTVLMMLSALPFFATTANALESTGNATFDAFINDSRWTNGIWWGDQRPKMNPSAGFYQCAAYCYDFTAYCYGIYNPRGGEAFYSAAEICAGDVITVGNPSGNGHWFVVLKRSGNSLYCAEGNYAGRVRIGWNYTVSGSRIAETTYNFNAGYHFLAPAHVHSYGAWQTVKSPTCISEGLLKRVCSCGDTQTQNIPKTSHNWNNGVTTKAATCESRGTMTFTCTTCKKTYTAAISALGHTYTSKKYPATCTKDAYRLYTCQRCGKQYTNSVTEWSEWSTSAPPADAILSEKKVQYRYKTKETSTGTAATKTGWTTEGTTWVKKSSGTHTFFTRPSGFNSSAFSSYASTQKSSGSSSTTKTVVSSPTHKSYIYWHWAFPYTYGVGTNTFIGTFYGDTHPTYPGLATVWEAFESNNDIREHTYSDSCVRVSGHSNYSYNWIITEVKQQTFTTYEKQYQYYRWSGWSAWLDFSSTFQSNQKVEQRVVYRYQTAENKAKGHTPDTAVKENVKEATYSEEGSYDSVVYCKVCHAQISRKTVSVPVLTRDNEIQYVLNGGTNNKKNPSSYRKDQEVKLNNPTKKGYTFKGWYREASYKTKVDKIKKGSTGKKVFYAKWSKNTYSITYKLNKGTNNKQNPKTYDVTKSVSLKNPTRKGYTFLGWYSDSKCTKKVSGIKKGATGNKVLYAKWKKK